MKLDIQGKDYEFSNELNKKFWTVSTCGYKALYKTLDEFNGACIQEGQKMFSSESELGTTLKNLFKLANSNPGQVLKKDFMSLYTQNNQIVVYKADGYENYKLKTIYQIKELKRNAIMKFATTWNKSINDHLLTGENSLIHFENIDSRWGIFAGYSKKTVKELRSMYNYSNQYLGKGYKLKKHRKGEIKDLMSIISKLKTNSRNPRRESGLVEFKPDLMEIAVFYKVIHEIDAMLIEINKFLDSQPYLASLLYKDHGSGSDPGQIPTPNPEPSKNNSPAPEIPISEKQKLEEMTKQLSINWNFYENLDFFAKLDEQFRTELPVTYEFLKYKTSESGYHNLSIRFLGIDKTRIIEHLANQKINFSKALKNLKKDEYPELFEYFEEIIRCIVRTIKFKQPNTIGKSQTFTQTASGKIKSFEAPASYKLNEIDPICRAILHKCLPYINHTQEIKLRSLDDISDSNLVDVRQYLFDDLFNYLFKIDNLELSDILMFDPNPAYFFFPGQT